MSRDTIGRGWARLVQARPGAQAAAAPGTQPAAPPDPQTTAQAAGTPRTRRPAPAASTLAIWVVLAVAAVLGLRSLLLGDVHLDADEAVTGIMTRRILAGQQSYVYFTSQDYNGSLEQYLQAALYTVTRLPQNPFTLRLVQVALMVLTTAVVHATARLILPRRWSAVLAAGLFALGPYYQVLLGSRSYGAYDSARLFALIAAYAALRASGFTARHPHRRGEAILGRRPSGYRAATESGGRRILSLAAQIATWVEAKQRRLGSSGRRAAAPASHRSTYVSTTSSPAPIRPRVRPRSPDVLRTPPPRHARPDSERPSSRAVAGWLTLFGVCSGLTLWSGLSGLEVLVPAAFWLLPTLVRSWRGAIGLLAGLVVGAIPMIVFFAQNGWKLPSLGSAPKPTTIADRAVVLWRYVARQLLGMQVAPLDRFPGPLVVTALILVAFCLVAALVVRRRGVLAVVTLQRSGRRASDLVLGILVVGVVIYLLSGFSSYRGSPRYLFVLTPFGAIGIALVFHWLWTTAARRAVKNVVALTALALVAAVTITGLQQSADVQGPQEGRTTDADLVAAGKYLESHGMTNVYAEYWTALPAQYFAGTGVSIAAWGTGQAKSGASREAVDRASSYVYLTSERNGVPDDETLRAALSAQNITFRPIHLHGNVTIYTDFSRLRRPAELGLMN